VSKATIRIAIAELVRDGYLRRQQGKGTFVTRSIAHSGMTMRTRLTEDMFGEGVKTRKELMEKGIKEPSEKIKRYLKMEGDFYRVLWAFLPLLSQHFYVSGKTWKTSKPRHSPGCFVLRDIVPNIFTSFFDR